VLTVALADRPIATMGGFNIVPHATLHAVRTEGAALLLLPGGDMWEQGQQPEVEALIRRFHEDGVPVGAICAATLEIARSGLSSKVRHTSNALSYLRSMVPEYRDHAFYVDDLAVSDQGIITASGLGSVEFAREIFQTLGLYSDKDLRTWYDMFKRGLMPATLASD
jgi:putative intracellular protease/amidase